MLALLAAELDNIYIVQAATGVRELSHATRLKPAALTEQIQEAVAI